MNGENFLVDAAGVALVEQSWCHACSSSPFPEHDTGLVLSRAVAVVAAVDRSLSLDDDSSPSGSWRSSCAWLSKRAVPSCSMVWQSPEVSSAESYEYVNVHFVVDGAADRKET